MDVLRQKSAPLSDETILWFEFLLKPNLLIKHLSKPIPTTELIAQFLSIAPENQNPNDLNSPETDSMNKNDGLKYSKKHLALKVLALKVAAYLRWDLDVLEKNLPAQRQVQLLSDLCSIAAGKTVHLPLSLVHESPIVGPEGSKHCLNFALALYHRWVLRAQVIRGSLGNRMNKPYGIGPGGVDANSMREEALINVPEPFINTSIEYLNRILLDPEPFRVLTFDSFVALDAHADSGQQRFESALPISKAELAVQIHYDLCMYYLYMQKYELAKQNIVNCKENLDQLKQEYCRKNLNAYIFCTVEEEQIRGCMMACGVSGEPDGLLERLNESVLNHYSDVVPILKEDNIRREIPMTQRKILELNVEGFVSMGSPEISTNDQRELELAVVALNVIRHVLDGDNILGSNAALQKYKSQELKLLELMLQYGDELYDELCLTDRDLLKKYFIQVITLLNNSTGVEAMLKSYPKLVSPQEFDDLKRQKVKDDIQFSGIGVQADWNVCESKMLRLDVGTFERQLITCTHASGVRKILVKLAGTNPTKPLWSINPSWSIPLPIKQLLMSLQRGFLQDFAYILVGKSRELAAKKDYSAAIALLTCLKSETTRSDLANNPLVLVLGKMAAWEGLLIQIQQVLEEWPKKPTDQAQFVRNCKQCLNSSTSNDIAPRPKILEHCAAILLNFNDWNSLLNPDKRYPALELSAAIAQAYLDIDKFKGTEKTSQEAWDLILPIFINQNTRQRHSTDNVTMLQLFLQKLRDPLVLSIVLSLLAKMYNIIKYESNLDLNAEYMFLWPVSIKNSAMYNHKMIQETLNNLLQQALKYYPNNIPWIKLKGDLEFSNGNHEAAMRYYVTALISGSEYCTISLQRPLMDEFIIRRMIKCCTSLGCYMQAAVLCQFLDETDYGLAFKSVIEKSSSFTDAMDSYYSCIWDPTLLEFIVNWHFKKGEHKRRLQAISYLGQLELNANNNEEIRREAAAVRKTRFLRSLARQYML
ncbi:integrator complex subunit 8 isoform X2 [Uranotaenia lowii]|uniref:integrator complex subunit 8 isoform X2 n=1 Tax=Uranotaenia lowii TaxID=190385 RepID=UPI00247B29E2|nr:integrator complex subunit 8 isoform X2 [Uranotaenia lowii]